MNGVSPLLASLFKTAAPYVEQGVETLEKIKNYELGSGPFVYNYNLESQFAELTNPYTSFFLDADGNGSFSAQELKGGTEEFDKLFTEDTNKAIRENKPGIGIGSVDGEAVAINGNVSMTDFRPLADEKLIEVLSQADPNDGAGDKQLSISDLNTIVRGNMDLIYIPNAASDPSLGLATYALGNIAKRMDPTFDVGAYQTRVYTQGQ